MCDKREVVVRLSWTYRRLRDVISRLLEGEGGGAFANGADVETPEPATFAVFGAGLGAVMLLRRFRR